MTSPVRVCDWSAAVAKKPTAPVLMVRKRAFNAGQPVAPAAARKPPAAPKKPATGAKARPLLGALPGVPGANPKTPKLQSKGARPAGGIPKAPKAGNAGKKPAKTAAKPSGVPAATEGLVGPAPAASTQLPSAAQPGGGLPALGGSEGFGEFGGLSGGGAKGPVGVEGVSGTPFSMATGVFAEMEAAEAPLKRKAGETAVGNDSAADSEICCCY